MARDIFTEPVELELDTLANLGPLAPLAGVWEGRGVDTHPVAEGSKDEEYLDWIELQPIDPQTNGPQLLYGLRYHQHIRRPDDPVTFHDQVGYWLWEPATGAVVQSLAIPRAQVALAAGRADRAARRFTVHAARGETAFGICSGPFLEEAFTTVEYSNTVTVNPDGTWSYEQNTVLRVLGRAEPFHHLDRCTLRRVAAPGSNPALLAARGTGQGR
jgi:hypothetical protein